MLCYVVTPPIMTWFFVVIGLDVSDTGFLKSLSEVLCAKSLLFMFEPFPTPEELDICYESRFLVNYLLMFFSRLSVPSCSTLDYELLLCLALLNCLL